MDKKLLAHLHQLTKSELTARAHKMGDVIDDLEEMAEILEPDEIDVIERAIRELRELRLRVENLESRLR